MFRSRAISISECIGRALFHLLRRATLLKSCDNFVHRQCLVPMLSPGVEHERTMPSLLKRSSCQVVLKLGNVLRMTCSHGEISCSSTGTKQLKICHCHLVISERFLVLVYKEKVPIKLYTDEKNGAYSRRH